jgi:hypothetical protein
MGKVAAGIKPVIDTVSEEIVPQKVVENYGRFNSNNNT